MGLYGTWKYRANVRIANPTSVANYQHKLTLSWLPGMRDDFRDIRFTALEGINCSYWIESFTSKVSAVIWIKVPPANQRYITLFYGNGRVSSASSGTATFVFFDDFTGAALDTGKWTNTGCSGTRTISGGLMNDVTTNRNIINGITDTNDATVVTSGRFRENSRTGADTGVRFGIKTNGTSGGAKLCMRSGQIAPLNEGVAWGSNLQTYNASEWYIFEIRHNYTNTFYYRVGHSGSWSSMAMNPGGTHLCVDAMVASGGSLNLDTDWVFQRKYAATEPTLTTVSHKPNLSTKWNYVVGAPTGETYAFDPVNIDHGMIADLGVFEYDIGVVNVPQGMSPAVGIVEYDLATYNIFHPIYPTASWAQIIDPVVDSGYLIGVTVSQSMDDAMAEAVFEYDGNEIGNYFSGDYMTQIHVNIPDHLGVSNCVFVGIIPSSHAVYDVAKDKMTMRAVDYGLFLTKQTMEIKDLSLLPPDDQAAEGSNVAKELHYDGKIKNFQIGMTVTGQISAATGTIVSLVSTTAQMMTLYPATGKFIDDEILRVGGVDYAVADGRSIDIPYTPYYATVYPEDWVRAILGGDNWMRTTGIEPCYLENSGGYWDTAICPAVPFMFGSLEKKRDALKRMAAYMSYLWHVKPRNLGNGNYVQSGYFIRQTSIDTLLGLPAAATIAGPDNFAGPITLDQDGELQVDVVKVRCQTLEGYWKEAIRSNSYYDAGEGPYREFADEPKDICTQLDLDAYAADMYNMYSARTCSWSATLLQRSDLQLYQLLNISGMGIEVPDGIYRIIKISHEFGCAKNLTHITFMLSSSFSTLLKYGMTYKDSISKVQQIVEGLENRKPQIELATVTATDGWTITYTTEAGNAGKGRDSTSTPAIAGAIPVGAKVQIQNSRGGIICIPIVAASGSSTDLLVVGVPTIVSATVDPADHNYWFLTWIAGTNNQTVSVNYQTTGYPSAPGVVLPYGNPASCRSVKYPLVTHSARIRFSGPNTGYYIKLWGEKNGVYSATGATATITSGADVTVGDIEEPEPIGVIDYPISGFFTGFETLSDQVYPVATLSAFSYNGTDNIYIGGPPTYTPDYYGDARDGWGNQPTPRYMMVDQSLVIRTVHDTITVGGLGYFGWFAPVNIKSILATGLNTITIELHHGVPGYYGVSALWVRTYYL